MASRDDDQLPDLKPSRAAAEVRLFHELASVAASHISAEEALQQCLDMVCAYVGWPVGHLYIMATDSSGELAPSKVWHLANLEAFDVFRSVTEQTRFAPGVGLPGRVLSSGEPAWIPDVQEDENFPRAKLARDIGVHGAFAFPVKVGSDTIGVLEFFTNSVATQDDAILRIMRLIGTQIGRILERTLAETRLEEANAELAYEKDRAETLFNVARIFANPGSFGERVTRALEEVVRATGVDSAHLRVPDDKEEGLRLVVAVGKGVEDHPPEPLSSYADTRAGRSFQTGEPIVDNEDSQPHGRTRAGYAQSAAWLPLKAAGRIMGVLAVGSSELGYFTPRRVGLLTDIANALGTFVENANLREAARLSDELQSLLNVASILSTSDPLGERVTRALAEVLRVAEADEVHFREDDDTGENLRLVAEVGRDAADAPLDALSAVENTRSGQVFKTGEVIVSNDPRERSRRSNIGNAQSGVWLPVKAGGRTVGVLTVNSREEGHFTPRRVQMLTAICSGIGPFVENAELREAERLHVEELETALDRLRTAQQQLIQSEKLAAVGTLISGVAHEINNPLGNILGRVQLLQRTAADDRSKRGLQTIRDECERAIRIVRNLLSFTREHKPETTLVSLNDTLDQVLELRAYELSVSNIELGKDFQADLPEISADPHQLQQVFLNLVINAEQAMTAAHGRGSLSITTQRVGDAVQVVVTDDGPGIPEELISQIFDPFFTTKDVGAGTGLGLSVCYGIVKEHGGEMRVESELEKGTTFTVELPLPRQG